MQSGERKGHAAESETRIAVGWQRLTKQEFVEALTAALLDKVQNHLSEHVDKTESSRSTDSDFVE